MTAPGGTDLHAAARDVLDELRAEQPELRRRLMVDLEHPAPTVRARGEDVRRILHDLMLHVARQVRGASEEGVVAVFLTVGARGAAGRFEVKVPQAEPQLGVADPALAEALRLLNAGGGRLSYAASPDGGVTISAELPLA
jgi:hypothetical protein